MRKETVLLLAQCIRLSKTSEKNKTWKKPPGLETPPHIKDAWVTYLKKTPPKKILPNMGIKKVSQKIHNHDNLGLNKDKHG